MDQEDVRECEETIDESIDEMSLNNLEIADDAKIGDATEVDDLESINQ